MEDNSNYYTSVDIGSMRYAVLAIDEYIDLDFEFTSDFTVSDIDVFLEDRSYQDYLGLEYCREQHKSDHSTKV